MNSKRNVWRWLRWVLLVVVGLPALALAALFAVALLKPEWLKPAAPPAAVRVPLPPSVLPPDSVLGPLHAFARPPRGLVRLLSPAPNAAGVRPETPIRLLLSDLGGTAEVRVFGGPGPYRLQVGEEGAETVVTPVGGWRAGERITVRVPGNRLAQFTTKAEPGGTFGRQGAVAVGGQPSFLQLADADADGDLDVFVLNLPDKTVSVRLNDGHGAFSAQLPDVDLYPRELNHLVVGDLNGDGAADLVTSDLGSPVAGTWLNDGHGQFATGWGVDTGPTDPDPSESDVRNDVSAALADVDGDGDLDLLFARWSRHGAVTVRFNDGTGAFGGGGTVAVDSYPSAPALGDLDGDGDLDLVTANYGAVRNSVSVRLNDGQGTFGGGRDLTAGARPTGVVLGDVDGDGRLDLLTCDVSHTASLCRGDGHGRFGPRQAVYLGCEISDLALSDVDGDGDLDLVGTMQPEALHQPARVSVWRNDGRGRLGAHNQDRQDISLPDHSDSIGLGDIDHNGTPDLLAALFADTVVVRFNQPRLPAR